MEPQAREGRFLDPAVVSRLGTLELKARTIVEGFLSGIHRSPYFGQSIEFLQHREYTRGDDPRHIDWKVWAKQDRYYVKQFEEETNLRCTLLVVEVLNQRCWYTWSRSMVISPAPAYGARMLTSIVSPPA